MEDMTAIDYIKELHRRIELMKDDNEQLQREIERLQSKIRDLENELYDLKHSEDNTNAS